MKHYVVNITDDAMADLRELSEFIARDSIEAAAKISIAILKAIDSLETMPQKFRQVGTTTLGRFPVHRMIEGWFLIYYRVETDVWFTF